MMQFRSTAIKPRAIKQGIVLFALAVVAAIVLPNYWTQNWSWNHLPQLAQQNQLKQLQQQGISLAGWQTLNQRSIQIGGHTWSVQAIAPETETVTPQNITPQNITPQNITPQNTTPQNTTLLLLRPQTWIRDLPQVDWMDINGIQQWQTDSGRSIQFQITDSKGQSVAITARFLRGWTAERTFAVMQWYAWSTGGSPSPTDWFWADQIARWQNRSPLPWVAISVVQPIAPLGNIETVRLSLEALAQQIQTTLTETVLQPALSPSSFP